MFAIKEISNRVRSVGICIELAHYDLWKMGSLCTRISYIAYGLQQSAQGIYYGNIFCIFDSFILPIG